MDIQMEMVGLKKEKKSLVTSRDRQLERCTAAQQEMLAMKEFLKRKLEEMADQVVKNQEQEDCLTFIKERLAEETAARKVL